MLLPTLATSLSLTAILLPSTLAAPAAPQPIFKRAPGSLIAMAPNSKTCAGAQFAAECKTAAQAAPFINTSFKTYGITSAGEAAALISLMAFESGDFKYNTNHFPGRPGQGTRNMQMPAFNMEYAKSIPALKDGLAKAGTDVKAVLALLTSNGEYDFGSAAWFMKTNCDEKVRSGLKTGTTDAWKMYITECIGTTVTADRQAGWEKAAKAMGVPGH
ncbi:MAG: hypothetical protein L6R42_008012 [Xanthoria sp. 1 TBL-2021]|nr:MAG: hypothetical protein L6R42_008012 [Xanthoria sp. 1 TBL-2021]